MYNKMPKVIRDYLRLGGQIVYCKRLIPGMTINSFVDMTSCEETTNLRLNCKIQHWEFYFHTVELYEKYDTFAIITQIKQLMNIQTKGVKK